MFCEILLTHSNRCLLVSHEKGKFHGERGYEMPHQYSIAIIRFGEIELLLRIRDFKFLGILIVKHRS